MEVYITLSENISNLNHGEYITKSQKDIILDLSSKINNSNQKSIDLKKYLQNFTSSKKLSKKLKLITLKIIEEIKKETNIDEIQIIDNIDDLEKNLDYECHRYNKYTENNPTEYISYDRQKERYILNYNKVIYKRKNLEELIVILKKNIGDKCGNKFSDFIPHKNIQYKNKKIIIYKLANIFYFDLNHIIELFEDLTAKNKKYAEYKDDIKYYSFRENNHKGFYIKEFIDKETFFKILLHTNSIFTNKFKDDISKILDELSNDNKLVISDDKLILKKPIDNFIENYVYTQTYDNQDLLDFIKKEIINTKKINWNKYVNKHIMYFFVITLEDPNGLNRILCKIGYSCDLIDRFKSLETEFKCKFYLMGIKTVFNIQDEKEFHALLKRKFPELVVNMKIGNHDKDETYVFDIELYKTYLCYVDKVPFTNEENKLEKDAEFIISSYFGNIEQRFEMELLLKFKNIVKLENITNLHQENIANSLIKVYYDLYKLRETNRHLEEMKNKEIELKKIELEITKKPKKN